jgi:hypothetical protein
MPFPLSIKGACLLPRAEFVGADLVEQAEQAVVSQGGLILQRSDQGLTFRVPFLRVSLWFFDHGSLRFEQSALGPRVHYQASCRRSAVVCACMAVWLGFVGGAASTWSYALPLAAGAWLWLFGLHYVAETIRFGSRFAHLANARPTASSIGRPG